MRTAYCSYMHQPEEADLVLLVLCIMHHTSLIFLAPAPAFTPATHCLCGCEGSYTYSSYTGVLYFC